ncbi:MAG: TonB-dependent receptor [Gammaproteobacteria bacterium]|nr:TonB-dependent receptor [Gammaproteobacteria bacterium]
MRERSAGGRRSPALLGGLLALAAVPLPAGEAADTELDTVTVYALRPTPVARVAAAVTVIDTGQMQRTQATDVKQLVRYQPGITVRSDPFRFGLDTFAVRGLGGNRVRVEIDGIPVAGGFEVGAYADSGRSFIDLAFVERVEILRGPASSLYGSDALGGIVAMRTLRPAALLDGAAAPLALRAQAGYQGSDRGWHAAAVGAAALGHSELLLGYVRRTGRELDSAAAIQPNPRDYRAESVMLQYVLPGFAGGPLRVTAEGGQVGQRTDVNALLGSAGRFLNTTALRGEDRARRHRLSLQQSLAVPGRLGNAEWRAYWQDTATRQDSLETRRAVPPRTPPLRMARRFELDARTVGLEASAVRSITAHHASQELVFGIEAAVTRLSELRDGRQTDLGTGSSSNTVLGEVMPVRDLPPSDALELGVFAQDELRLSGTPWSFIPALRLDYYRLRPRPDAIYREDNPASPAVGLEHVSLAPKFGVSYQFDAALGGYFQYAHGFRSPPPEDVNIGFDIPLFNYRALPNPQLQPERSEGYEIGLRWRSTALQLDGSMYYNDYRDFIESRINLGVDPVSGTTLFQSRNVAAAHIYGAEFALRLRGAGRDTALAGWSASLNGTWSRGSDRSRQQPLNSVGPPNAVAGLRYEAASGRWGSELLATLTGAKHAVDRSRADVYATSGCTTLDWQFNAEPGGGLALNAGVFNLADRACIEWEDVRGRANGDPLLPYYTRPGRSVSLTVHWQR